MKLTRNLLAASLAALIFAPAAHAEITIDSVAGSEVSFEGLVQADFIYFDEDKFDYGIGGLNRNASNDGRRQEWSMRRAELVLKGKGPGNNEWVMGYDAYGKKWLDVNWKYKIGGNSNHFVQVGQYKQLNSMEELTSTKNNDFIAKANITNTFGVGRRLGAMYSFGDNNWAIAGSVFGRELTRGGNRGNGFGVRGYFAPINADGTTLHLGLSYNRYEAELATYPGTTQWDRARLRSRPNADIAANRYVDTGNIDRADTVAILGGEALFISGPFKVQGEYMKSTVTRKFDTLKDWSGSGGYVSAVWNVTGEKFGYKGGTPSTPLPNEPATGMFQIGLRYDTLDLNDGTFVTVGGVPTVAPYTYEGGKMDTWTLGANWYWHSNFKVSLNYVAVKSSKFYNRTPATFSADPAWNNRVVNGKVQDDPSMIEARFQFYW